MRNKNYIFYDFEVYPTFWSVVFLIDNGMTTITNDTSALMKFVISYRDTHIFIGYNSANYDIWILEALWIKKNQYRISKAILNDTFKQWEEFPYVKKEGLKSQIINVDLMAINKKQCAHSLKVLEGNLGLDLLECPVPFDKLNLTYNDMVQIILYNQEDVRATKAVFEWCENYGAECKSRLASIETLQKAFLLPRSAISLTPGNLTVEICKCDKSRVITTPFFYKKPNCINPRNKELVDFYESIKFYNDLSCDFSLCDPDTLKKYKVKGNKLQPFQLENGIVYGLGGIHYANKKLWETKPGVLICHLDVSGYYPHLLANPINPEFRYLTRSSKIGWQGFWEIPVIRAKAKQTKDKSILFRGVELDVNDVKSGFKLPCNAISGKMGSSYSSAFDQEQITSLRITGQLLITEVCEMLQDIGAEIINLNTDGVWLSCKESQKTLIEETFNERFERMGLSLEWEWIRNGLMVQRDVNNFIVYDYDTKHLESKGEYAVGVPLDFHGMNVPVIQTNSDSICYEAFIAYAIHRVNPEQTIKNAIDKNEWIKFQRILKGQKKNIIISRQTNCDIYKRCQEKWEDFILFKNGSKQLTSLFKKTEVFMTCEKLYNLGKEPIDFMVDEMKIVGNKCRVFATKTGLTLAEFTPSHIKIKETCGKIEIDGQEFWDNERKTTNCPATVTVLNQVPSHFNLKNDLDLDVNYYVQLCWSIINNVYESNR